MCISSKHLLSFNELRLLRKECSCSVMGYLYYFVNRFLLGSLKENLTAVLVQVSIMPIINVWWCCRPERTQREQNQDVIEIWTLRAHCTMHNRVTEYNHLTGSSFFRCVSNTLILTKVLIAWIFLADRTFSDRESYSRFPGFLPFFSVQPELGSVVTRRACHTRILCSGYAGNLANTHVHLYRQIWKLGTQHSSAMLQVSCSTQLYSTADVVFNTAV